MLQRTRIALGLLVIASVPILGMPPARAGASCHAPATDRFGHTVVIRDLCFGPTVLWVAPGTTVTWINRDGFAHNVTGLGALWGSDGDLSYGDRLAVTFRAPGIYPYACYIHWGMTGVVAVGDVAAPATATGIVPLSGPAPPSPTAAGASASRSSLPAGPARRVTTAGLWPATTAAGFVLAIVFGFGFMRQRRSLARRRSTE